MNLIQKFMEMSDSEIEMAFKEYLNHEKTGILIDGIIREISEQLPSNPLNILNVEHALLREMAGRWFYNRNK